MLSPEQILALAPDDASSKAAKGLLAPAKWPTLGFTDAAIWGECQGSGSKPYQTMIDLAGPTFKCSCPSRKFPCKHGLALYLLRAQKEDAFKAHEAPAWVADWLTSRRDRAEKQAEKKAVQADGKPEPPADPEAAAKREAKRLERMINGARDLERWLADLIRHGISDLPVKTANFWKDAAARLVDAQASGLANLVRQLEAMVHSGEGWAQRALMHMGRVQLLLDALQHLESLPEGLRADVRTAAGWPVEKEEVMARGERVDDSWLVQGVSFDENEKLWERRVWLRGLNCKRQALLLDFSHGQRRYEDNFIAGGIVKGTLVFYPSAFPLRAMLVDAIPTQLADKNETTASASWEEALESVADAYAGNPWLARLPVCLEEVTPVMRGSRWHARDAASREVPLRVSDDDGWELLALSGGRPVKIFGEWLGELWRPLGAWTVGAVTPCWTEGVSAA